MHCSSTFAKGASHEEGRTLRSMIARRFLLAVGLTATASAQTFSVSSCGGVTATVSVTGQLTEQPVTSYSVTVGGMVQSYTTYTWTFAASMSLTGSNLNGNGLGVMTVVYYNPGAAGATTTFGIATNLDQQSGLAIPGFYFQLQGDGTLLTQGVF